MSALMAHPGIQIVQDRKKVSEQICLWSSSKSHVHLPDMVAEEHPELTKKNHCPIEIPETTN